MIEVVGIGLDGATGLSENVREIVENATLLVGSARHLSYFPKHPAKKLVFGNFLEVIKEIQQHVDERVVILVSGDPLFFGLGRLLLEKFSSEQLRFHPHLTSVQLAFNRIKVPWQDAKVISVHGRSLEELTPLLQQGVEKIAILTDEKNNPSAIARFYLGLDLPTRYDFWICENLEDSQEKVSQFSAIELADLPANNFTDLNIVILLRQSEEKERPLNVENLPLLGLPDSIFLNFQDRPGLMTKRETRLCILGELGLKDGQIIWDIGAGTGSVSIEIARLCPSSQIYAIEKTAMGINLIEKNCLRLQVSNVIPIHGNAPDLLTDLPEPNRIFIGGSGGNLLDILETCQKKIASDGILVLALATLEHLNSSLVWLRDRDWSYRLLQVQISRSVPIGNMTRFSPLNPVTIITARLN
ncbi:cobalamin biosynthesis bifunctional protein CbiET [Hydrococcus rivularis NIES-593]|uniref:tRNA (guanine(46)-N(7))-methyltransferase n=1 Tax=Hydrococcus rivularis NIES-593 TaxID=1921803 RepID=A0A1U7HI44_9CYAN|nr:precorrin-6y C5,15-methyltransferase (decarboxylating) subunit CbiE [Hydrococcus rivularis]OKH23262.1 cobalamin biosynthesis bifunctional protein CbiET [Hydrococcus rivularis NIES-593]